MSSNSSATAAVPAASQTEKDVIQEACITAANLGSVIYELKRQNPDSRSLRKADKAYDKLIAALRERRTFLQREELPF